MNTTFPLRYLSEKEGELSHKPEHQSARPNCAKTLLSEPVGS